MNDGRQQAQGEPVAPHILEALSWHSRERDDLTLEQAVEAFRFGYKTVRQRDDRAMLAQLIELMASAPAPQADEVRDAARYRWLRNQNIFEQVGSTSPYVVRGQTLAMIDGAELDAAVDAAIKRTTTVEQEKP